MAQFEQDLDRLGKNIQNIVDSAVNSRDFQRLNQTVRQTVGRVVDLGSETARKMADLASDKNRAARQNVKKLYGKTFSKMAKSVLKLCCGIPLALVSALGIFGCLAAPMIIIARVLAIVVLLVLLGAGTWLNITAGSTIKMIMRFNAYKKTLGLHTQCPLEKLARSVDKSEKFVRRDVCRMIESGLFLEGHLDKEQTRLITSDETFRYFEQSRLQLEQRQRMEAAARAQKEAIWGQNPQVREILERGDAFLAQIRRCNDDIPGQEISEKISRIENIVQRIFDRVEAHPELVPDLKKLMNYYLPMTVKLLDAYADMDAQPVQGENILASKQEIEQTLDTLNLAYEKLLDELFADTALDVSSDISVLNTLLAQEGLTEDAFSRKQPTATNNTGTGE